jgi:Fur family ferric uptake transcriptional regulator
VLEALYAAGRPVSARDIARGLDGTLPPSDDASVYRALELLRELGLAQELTLGHGPALYATLSGGPRDYLVCERCGTITAVDPRVLEPVRGAIARAFGWQVDFGHVPLAGVCPACG